MSTQYNDHEINRVRITPEELRKYKGFESISDAKAEQVIDILLKLSIMCYNHLEKTK